MAEAQSRDDVQHENSPEYGSDHARAAPGAVYFLGMVGASLVSAVLLAVGLSNAQLNGPALVLLAAAFPLAGLVWALILSYLAHRNR